MPPAVLAELVDAARDEGAELSVPDPSERRRLLTLTVEGERRNITDPMRREESCAWGTTAPQPVRPQA